jgi:regulatory Fis family protein
MRSNVTPEIHKLAVQMLTSGIGYHEALERFEAGYVREAVRSCNGNQCEAANAMGIHRNTVSRILARSRQWIVVWRLSTGRVWPREYLGEIGQAVASESADMLALASRKPAKEA